MVNPKEISTSAPEFPSINLYVATLPLSFSRKGFRQEGFQRARLYQLFGPSAVVFLICSPRLLSPCSSLWEVNKNLRLIDVLDARALPARRAKTR